MSVLITNVSETEVVDTTWPRPALLAITRDSATLPASSRVIARLENSMCQTSSCHIGAVYQNHAIKNRIDKKDRRHRQMHKHRPLIMNWFEAKGMFASGIVEGFNYKAKLTMRISYSFRTLKAIEIALYLAIRGLPASQTTHRFI